MFEIGARVVVESEKVGTAPRTGVITEVAGSVVHIRWDDGHETSFVPAAGALRLADEQPPPKPSA